MPRTFDVPVSLRLVKTTLKANRVICPSPSPEVNRDFLNAEEVIKQIGEVWAKLEEYAQNDPRLKEILGQQIAWN